MEPLKRGYRIHLRETIKCLYNNNTIHIDISGKISEEISINQGVRQGSSLSSTLFNIYIDDMLRTWKTVTNTGIQVNNTFISTLLFADDQVILQNLNMISKQQYINLTQIAKN
jgi:hypothetical protein